MICVTLVCAPAPRQVFEEILTLPDGATVQQAVDGSALSASHAVLNLSDFVPGVWGKVTAWDRVLGEGDRLELCRALTVDPKVARRERFRQQGARGTGLFARRREGGKSGY
jgi:putative ubiquitin-RnfH superfamily antitoxin RatB of RatAB toxin-antitoxin module